MYSYGVNELFSSRCVKAEDVRMSEWVEALSQQTICRGIQGH